MTWRFSFINM